MERFEDMLKGGHPNSLGCTVEVVEQVLAQPARFEELFCCYKSTDKLVRLRTSNAMKRVQKANHALLVPYIHRLISEVAPINQASVQWTIAQLFEALTDDISADQLAAAKAIVQGNLASSSDWIVLKNSMDALAKWAKQDQALADWLQPHLQRLTEDPRKAVAGRAKKLLGYFLGADSQL